MSPDLRAAIGAHLRGPRVAATLSMGPVSALAILVLHSWGIVAKTPLWVIPLLLVGGQLVAYAADVWWLVRPTRWSFHARIASQAMVVTAVIFATGLGASLAVGLVLVGQESLTVLGSRAYRAVLGWSLGCLAVGECLLAAGWFPALLPLRQMHGLAFLVAIGIAHSFQTLTIAVRAKDEATAEVRHQATHDSLTGLPNRTLLYDRLNQALLRRARYGSHVAVLVIDLDGFKTVNDSVGHLAGDALLVSVANRFTALLRDVDTIARLGGDEFAIVVDQLDVPEYAGQVAQRVLDALAEPFPVAGRHFSIGASIGSSLADAPDVEPETLLSNADTAMYRAKHEGKGRYRVFDPTMRVSAVERVELEQTLRRALREGSVTVHYQPVVDAGTQCVSALEAFARWDHPVHGSISPEIFMPVAEESGSVVELAAVVLDQALSDAARWRTEFPDLDLGIAVNVSGVQLARKQFVPELQHALRTARVDPACLTLEIAESALVSDSAHVTKVLGQIRGTGIKIAMDDFGTGHSSLTALAELPIDMLKIHESFIDRLVTGHDGRGFVYAIMQVARTLDLLTVAEGVEQTDQRDELVKLGCTHLQGGLFAEPMAAREVDSYLRKQVTSLVRASDT